MQDLVNLTSSIVSQLLIDLKRLESLGIQKIGVTALEPLGCLPPFTASSSHQNCSEALNLVSGFHNRLLKQSLKDLTNQSEKCKIIVLDLYSAFMSAFATLQHKTAGNFSHLFAVIRKRPKINLTFHHKGKQKYMLISREDSITYI